MAWTDVGQKSSSGKSEVIFAKLKAGTTQIRILDEQPFSRWTHWLPAANAGKGVSITCIGKDCPVCAIIKEDKANKAKKPRFTSRKMHAINVLNRTDSEVQILDKGNGLFEQIVGIIEEMQDTNGDICNYDVKIRVSGADKDTTYVVIPCVPTVLTKEEAALKKYELEKIFPIFTAEQVTQLMNGATFDSILNPSSDNDINSVDDIDDIDVDFTEGDDIE